MSGYVKIFGDIIESSIWQEPSDTKVVWITLLALADSEGFVRGSEGWLSLRARVPLDACRNALKKFMEPDPLSRTATDEGRRIEETPDGWVIINYAFYREQDGRELSKDPRRVYQREWMRKKRSGCQHVSTEVNCGQPSASAYASVTSSDDSPKTPEGLSGEPPAPAPAQTPDAPPPAPPVPAPAPVHSFKQWTADEFKASIRAANTDGLLSAEECRDFFGYWTEPTPSGRFRMHMEKTWDTRRRMHTAIRIVYGPQREKAKRAGNSGSTRTPVIPVAPPRDNSHRPRASEYLAEMDRKAGITKP